MTEGSKTKESSIQVTKVEKEREGGEGEEAREGGEGEEERRGKEGREKGRGND